MQPLISQVNRKVDVSGLQCPQPIIKCKAALALMMNDQILHVISTEFDMNREVASLLSNTDNVLLRSEMVDHQYHFYIRKNEINKPSTCFKKESKVSINIYDYIHSDYVTA